MVEYCAGSGNTEAGVARRPALLSASGLYDSVLINSAVIFVSTGDWYSLLDLSCSSSCLKRKNSRALRKATSVGDCCWRRFISEINQLFSHSAVPTVATFQMCQLRNVHSHSLYKCGRRAEAAIVKLPPTGKKAAPSACTGGATLQYHLQRQLPASSSMSSTRD